MSAAINTEDVQLQLEPPPAARMIELITGYIISQAISVVSSLNIADLLKDGPKTADELAQLTNTHSQSLFRLMRALSSVGVFGRDAQNHFHLTSLSETLCSDTPGSLRAFSIMMGEKGHWQIYAEMLHSVRTGETAFEHIHGVGPFEFFSKNPEIAQIFDNAMTSFTSSIAPAVVASYDFSKVSTIADIAGGHGILLSQILKANPQTKGILFDVPYVAEGARALLEHEGLANRCEIVSGDFFETIPSGADVYLMKHIIHDWDEERALIILRNIHKAMPENGKLLLVEMVLPEQDEPSLGPLIDIEMLLIPGGRERTAQEYAELFEKAGFRLTQVIPTHSPMRIVEGVKV